MTPALDPRIFARCPQCASHAWWLHVAGGWRCYECNPPRSAADVADLYPRDEADAQEPAENPLSD